MLTTLLLTAILSTDGGTPDAGRPPARSSWVQFDGGAALHGNVTDDVVITVGSAAQVSFPQNVISTRCDDLSVIAVSDTETSFVFTGLKPGTTHCGFWYSANAFPHRYVEIVVKPR